VSLRSGRCATLAVIALTLAALHATNPDVGAHYGAWESILNVQAATAPFTRPADPYYGYRLLPPLLVWLVPVRPKLAFLLVDYTSLAGAALLIAEILVAERIGRGLATLAAVLFLSFPGSTKWLVTYSAGPDAFYVFMIAAAYRALQRDRWGWSAIPILLGTFAKPTMLLLVAVAVCRLASGAGPASARLRRAAAGLSLAVPALLALLVVRLVWPPAPRGFLGQPLAAAIFENVQLKLSATSAMLPGILPQWVELPAAFLIVFGMVALVLLTHARESLRILWARPDMLVFLLATEAVAFVVSYDLERCQLYLAIPVLYVFARVIQANASFYARPAVAAALVAAQAGFSELATLRPADFTRYMSHYMPPRVAAGYLVAWLAAGIALATLRWIGSPRRRG
jgi:hypothetical protein